MQCVERQYAVEGGYYRMIQIKVSDAENIVAEKQWAGGSEPDVERVSEGDTIIFEFALRYFKDLITVISCYKISSNL